MGAFGSREELKKPWWSPRLRRTKLGKFANCGSGYCPRNSWVPLWTQLQLFVLGPTTSTVYHRAWRSHAHCASGNRHADLGPSCGPCSSTRHSSKLSPGLEAVTCRNAHLPVLLEAGLPTLVQWQILKWPCNSALAPPIQCRRSPAHPEKKGERDIHASRSRPANLGFTADLKVAL